MAELMSQPNVGWCTPMILCTSIERSIAFYEHLAFEVIDTDRCEPIGWARLHHRGGALMLLRAEGPMPKQQRGAMFVLYTPELEALREYLLAQDINCGAIHYPPYAPAGDCMVKDPDDWDIEIVQWGAEQQKAWLERIGRPDPYESLGP